ncbi:MAG TPA: glycoside hydrolase family 20 zincin-like fold domain-containing protein, partial [Ferruginibacter sp.]|nr:glycoside hydrolase family 20 zincin-like fold domain-containing protein [Ferruginibacter sp.]
MKKTISFLLLFACLISKAQNSLNIVPMPAEVKMGTGVFNIDKNSVIVLEGSGLEKSAAFLNDQLQKNLGYKLKVAKDHAGSNAIRLNYERLDNEIPGAYNLTVDNKGV